jgi:hypothetical protein
MPLGTIIYITKYLEFENHFKSKSINFVVNGRIKILESENIIKFKIFGSKMYTRTKTL